MYEVLSFRQVRVTIPSSKLRKMYYSYDLLPEEKVMFLRAILTRIDQAQNKLAHARSVVEKIALRTQGFNSVTCYKEKK